MNRYYKYLPIFTITLMLIISCNNPEEIITPTHYSRVPRAVNLSVSYDTSAVGTYRVVLNWAVESTTNLKDFEIYRNLDQAGFFFLIGGITSTSYIDSSLSNSSDSLNISYFVNGRGLDRFVGQSSDTIKILVTKTF